MKQDPRAWLLPRRSAGDVVPRFIGARQGRVVPKRRRWLSRIERRHLERIGDVAIFFMWLIVCLAAAAEM